MPSPLDSLTLPNNATALRTLLLAREAEHAAELEAARNGLKNQAPQIEQLKARLAKLLRQRFGSSSEKLRGQIDQLRLMIGDLEEEYAETTPAEPESEPEPEIQARDANPNATRCRKIGVIVSDSMVMSFISGVSLSVIMMTEIMRQGLETMCARHDGYVRAASSAAVSSVRGASDAMNKWSSRSTGTARCRPENPASITPRAAPIPTADDRRDRDRRALAWIRGFD